MDQVLLYPIISSLATNHAGQYGIIVSLIVMLGTLYGKQMLDFSKRFIPDWTRKTKFTITAHITERNNSLWTADFPKSFLAVNRTIYDYILEASKAQKLSFEVNQYRQYTSENDRPPVVFFNLTGVSGVSGIPIAPNLVVYTNVEKTHGDKDYVYTTLSITIKSTRHDYSDIKKFVSKTIVDYEELVLLNMKGQHVFVFDKYDTTVDSLMYREIPFHTNKGFDNMFFDDKETVIQAIDYFSNNEEHYNRLGMPHTLGFLFHGIKGAGKTSCIKSIAKYTQRHIVIIPMKRIKSIDTLKKIFLEREINGIIIPNKRRLYVFEEIDCGTWARVVACRQSNASSSASSQDPTAAAAAADNNKELLAELIACLKPAADLVETPTHHTRNGMLSSAAQPASAKSESDDVNLGEFLELLDGIIEIPGRMIIMTSNHPEVLDRALIRPGRIDHVIEFRHLSRKNVCDLYKLWFNREVPEEIAADVRDYAFTQAEIGNIFSTQDTTSIHKRITQQQQDTKPI